MIRLSKLTNLDSVAERILVLRGECRYCRIYHPAKQCQSPRNWSSEPPAQGQIPQARAIMSANEAAMSGVEVKERPVRILPLKGVLR